MATYLVVRFMRAAPCCGPWVRDDSMVATRGVLSTCVRPRYEERHAQDHRLHRDHRRRLHCSPRWQRRLAEPSEYRRRLWHPCVLPFHRYDSLGTQDLRRRARVSETRNQGRRIRPKGQELHLLTLSTVIGGAARRVRHRGDSGICEAPARDAWEGYLDDGWGGAHRILSR